MADNFADLLNETQECLFINIGWKHVGRVTICRGIANRLLEGMAIQFTSRRRESARCGIGGVPLFLRTFKIELLDPVVDVALRGSTQRVAVAGLGGCAVGIDRWNGVHIATQG